MPSDKQTKQVKSPQDYEHLARVLEDIYLSGYANKKRLLKENFLKGLAGGVGGVIGATIVIAMLLWILARLNQVPLVGPFTDKVEHTIENRH